jgi:hypothetical protein
MPVDGSVHSSATGARHKSHIRGGGRFLVVVGHSAQCYRRHRFKLVYAGIGDLRIYPGTPERPVGRQDDRMKRAPPKRGSSRRRLEVWSIGATVASCMLLARYSILDSTVALQALGTNRQPWAEHASAQSQICKLLTMSVSHKTASADAFMRGFTMRGFTNSPWTGYDRIVGALANLGYEISDQTVGNILQRHALPPAPERKHTTTWPAFIRTHLALLAGTDFFTAEVLTLRGLVTYYVLFSFTWTSPASPFTRTSAGCSRWPGT